MTVTNAPSIAIVNLLAAIWRRGRTIALPLLACGAAAVLAAYFMPRTYVARSLFMLQEADQGPLAREQRLADLSTEAGRERVLGLQTLMKSERILVSVLTELKDKALDDPKSVAAAVQTLRDSLSMQVISPEFLEIQLKGSSQIGLGHQLETVMAVLFENLIAPEQNGETASELVMIYRKEQLDAAETELRALRLRHPELARLRAASSVSEAATSGQATARPTSWHGAPAPTTTPLPAPAVTALGESAQLPAPETLNTATVSGEPLDATYRKLEDRASRARDEHAQISRRVGGLRSGQTVGILRAPERILVIDPPRDPQLPLLSKTKIIIIGLMLGTLLGAGFGLLAELFDTRVRSARQLANLIKAPVLARLPFDTRGFV